jgi:uncharacterized protein YlxW (UPF0749 family)
MPSDGKRPLADRILPWTAGITLPLLVVVLSALWGVSNNMSAIAAENEVLKVRASHTENAILDMKSTVSNMQNTVKTLEVNQSTHNALMQSKIDGLSRDMDKLLKALEKNSEQ